MRGEATQKPKALKKDLCLISNSDNNLLDGKKQITQGQSPVAAWSIDHTMALCQSPQGVLLRPQPAAADGGQPSHSRVGIEVAKLNITYDQYRFAFLPESW